ncbi:5-formyltetrahydrofolate cyclo-ligase [Nocardia huaxiensis]|uniref:5-formyltetrahydrofolate cyclo-ligase n=1 Tax=Nocardia huaxiensis TaxID=2755382 RepID=UPI001E31ECC7|nr:5-formyltetrahydrofolate cyclo-ligase [Nocardia huaxiensis]UFT00117.1 5-formyltetrahydrofolate cyclo-ligase [Nocardia huaxiensis]
MDAWDKRAWREAVLARRKTVTADEREREADALAAGVARLAAPGGPLGTLAWVCAYVPVGGEPGSLAMLDALRAGGVRVLLPVTGEPGPLEWAEYTGPEALRRGRFGLREPSGAPIANALGKADALLIPALAVDRRGVRLGRGAGYYDRSLAACRTDARLIAVVRDDELVGHLPEEPHDHRMGWALTPFGGLLALDEQAGN